MILLLKGVQLNDAAYGCKLLRKTGSSCVAQLPHAARRLYATTIIAQHLLMVDGADQGVDDAAGCGGARSARGTSCSWRGTAGQGTTPQ